MEQTFVLYARVSTRKQDLGIDAQRDLAYRYVSGVGGMICAEYSEKESGRHDDRPQLAAAIEACKTRRATLLIAKLDRLSRDAGFLFLLKKKLETAGVSVIVAENPSLYNNTIVFGVMASMAQQEAEMISARTKAALAALKQRGVHLGKEPGYDMLPARTVALEVIQSKANEFARKNLPVVRLMFKTGASLNAIAIALNAEGRPSRRGGRWTATSVKRLLERSC